MSRVLAVSDIHGCSKTFKKLLLEKIRITKTDKIYCLGDYIDRGPDSKGVIDFILRLRSNGYSIHTLRGNHEEMMLHATQSEERMNHWLRNGAGATLKSFGIKTLNDLPEIYSRFLTRTKYYIATSDYLFVHAGLNFSSQDPMKDKHAMLWTREEHFDKSKIKNRILIHGHTPIKLAALLNQTNPFKINIDSGCVYTHKPGYGNLTALSLPEGKFITLKNID